MLKEIIAATEEGVYGGETYILTLKNKGLKIALNPDFDIPSDVKEKANAVIDGIINGSITITP
jgi:basic membrane lipoprotein Med (substrate-binding protein (PBP1-ABC) superfamily)